MNRTLSLCVGLSLLPACNHERPQQQAATTHKESSVSTGATSPSGESHPGEIAFDDKVDGRTYTRKAAEVPVSIAWVEVAGRHEPVLRIEITGTTERREITKFGRDGKFLETTVQAPPRPAGGGARGGESTRPPSSTGEPTTPPGTEKR